MRTDEQTPDEVEVVHVSKSQKKRDALVLQDLGKFMMTKLKPEAIHALPMSQSIQTAVIAGKSMKMGALKRQVQYVGKLLREEDEADLAALKQALARYLK